MPAGLVVHDPVVLADTLMMPTRQITGVALVGPRSRRRRRTTSPGPTPGVTVGIALAEMTTVVLAPRPATPRGTAIHLAALLVAPSRPGAVLAGGAPRPRRCRVR